MATIALAKAQLDWNSFGGSAEYENIALSSGAAPIAGDLCFKVNNTLDVCGSDPAQITWLIQEGTAGTIPGISTYSVQKIKPSEVYLMNAYSATASLAVIADTALDAQSNYGIVKATVPASTGTVAWCLDVDDTVFIKVRIVDRLDSATDIYPRCRVQFIQSVLTFI